MHYVTEENKQASYGKDWEIKLVQGTDIYLETSQYKKKSHATDRILKKKQ